MNPSAPRPASIRGIRFGLGDARDGLDVELEVVDRDEVAGDAQVLRVVRQAVDVVVGVGRRRRDAIALEDALARVEELERLGRAGDADADGGLSAENSTRMSATQPTSEPVPTSLIPLWLVA